MRLAAVCLILLGIALPADAALSMNDVLIPEGSGAVSSALRQLAESLEKKPVSSTVYINANGQRIAKIVNNETFYFHNDHLGSATVVTDSMGNIVEEKRYDPFGVELAGGSKIGYNSKELDKDTELNYYGARYYAAGFGRFVTPDTVKGKLSNPQSLNLYAYTLNNPLKYVDPNGNRVILSGTKDQINNIFSQFQKLAGGAYLETRRTSQGEIEISKIYNEKTSRNPKTIGLIKKALETDFILNIKWDSDIGELGGVTAIIDPYEDIRMVMSGTTITIGGGSGEHELTIAHELFGHGLNVVYAYTSLAGEKTRTAGGLLPSIRQEGQAMAIENIVRRELGYEQRRGYVSNELEPEHGDIIPFLYESYERQPRSIKDQMNDLFPTTGSGVSMIGGAN